MAFFDLQNGLKLAIWPRRSISHDTDLLENKPNPIEFTLGHNVSSKEEVDEVMKQAKNAGATIVKPAVDTFWVVTQAIFKTLIITFGRWFGILI